MNKTLNEIAELVGGTLIGDGETVVTGLNGIKDAREGDLTFYADPRYDEYLQNTPAAAVLVPEDFQGNGRTIIRVPNPYLAFAQLLSEYEETVRIHPEGIHPSAVIADSARLGQNVAVDAQVCVSEGAIIGDGVVLYGGVYVGRNVKIGSDTVVYPNATVRERVTIGARCVIHANAVIGSDGFGFTRMNGAPVKIPQVGAVVLGDDVEVGSNTAIDRATTGTTTIGRGTKIDNLVQIGHNVSIGENCTISGGCGIGGSTTIGNNVAVGGQVGIAGHVQIGDHVMIAAGTGIHRSIPAHSIVSGSPQQDHRVTRKIWASLPHVPGLLKRFRKLESRVDTLERHSDGQTTNDR